MEKSLKVAVTGSTGFLGSHLISHLVSQGHYISALTRRKTNLSSRSVDWVYGDILDKGVIEKLVEGVDIVIHAAGVIKAIRQSEFFRINRDGTKLIASVAERKGVKKFILVSSLVARDPNISPYAFSKWEAELAVRKHSKHMVVNILRPPVIYGPGDTETVRLFKMATNGFLVSPPLKTARVSMIHVKDVTSAIVACFSNNSELKTMEIDDGSDNGYSWADLANTAGFVLGRKVNLISLPKILVWFLGLCGTLQGLVSLKPSVLTLMKVPELLHRDWVVRGVSPDNWKPAWTLEKGFKDSINWYSSRNILKRFF